MEIKETVECPLGLFIFFKETSVIMTFLNIFNKSLFIVSLDSMRNPSKSQFTNFRSGSSMILFKEFLTPRCISKFAFAF